MDIVVQLQESHTRGHLGCYVDELVHGELCTAALHVLQERAVLHEFHHNVDGLLQGADSVELDQLRVPETFEDSSFLKESLGRHGAWAKGLDGHWGRAVPDTLQRTAQM